MTKKLSPMNQSMTLLLGSLFTLIGIAGFASIIVAAISLALIKRYPKAETKVIKNLAISGIVLYCCVPIFLIFGEIKGQIFMYSLFLYLLNVTAISWIAFSKTLIYLNQKKIQN